MTHPLNRWSTAAALVLAPAFGLVAAITAPALATSTGGELRSISTHPGQFHVYALTLLVSSYLMVPAVFGLMNLVRGRSRVSAYVAGGLTQVGMLIAIGDAAVESMYWAMGSRPADHTRMVLLADRYESGTAWIYSIGGLSLVVGSILLAVVLRRCRALPLWAALGVPVSGAVNIAGFASGSQLVLIVSYLVMLAAFARAAVEITVQEHTEQDPRRPLGSAVARATA